eukprot:CAMPEP_0179206312 /NCGR_PEP_ID=MMETSP0796-20121207/102871_1 /TAXON_ID=73915 /ORGANISM="Pyrodinium bahamense, Strain pbaha01" /LENGTH=191 /DNA_ID=CAMNT_0020911231 /DNA_START=36 /DNA_END=612 /DNA_ORIENTATION=+
MMRNLVLRRRALRRWNAFAFRHSATASALNTEVPLPSFAALRGEQPAVQVPMPSFRTSRVEQLATQEPEVSTTSPSTGNAASLASVRVQRSAMSNDEAHLTQAILLHAADAAVSLGNASSQSTARNLDELGLASVPLPSLDPSRMALGRATPATTRSQPADAPMARAAGSATSTTRGIATEADSRESKDRQ